MQEVQEHLPSYLASMLGRILFSMQGLTFQVTKLQCMHAMQCIQVIQLQCWINPPRFSFKGIHFPVIQFHSRNLSFKLFSFNAGIHLPSYSASMQLLALSWRFKGGLRGLVIIVILQLRRNCWKDQCKYDGIGL
jgi:hypothetical protein